MACAKDNSLSETDIKIMQSIKETSLSIDDIATQTEMPLFRVRSVLRKLAENNLVKESEGKYTVVEQ